MKNSYRFNSPQTSTRLKHDFKIQIKNPNIDLSERKEIDEVFNQMCKESRKEFFSEKKSILKGKADFYHPSVRQRNSELIQNEIDNFLKEGKLNYLKENIVKTYNNDEKIYKNLGIVNPLVHKFGNGLIAAIFKSLIINTIETEFNVHIDDPMAISFKMLSHFGISGGHLKDLKTKEEKFNYILAAMNTTIEKLLKTWNEKIEMHKKQQEEVEENYKNQKKKSKNETQDIFEWMILKTKYKALEKKLKTLVVQKLNDYENQLKVLQLFKERRTRRETMHKIRSTELKLTLKNVDAPPTNELLKSKFLNSDTFISRRTTSSAKSPTTLNRPPSATISFMVGKPQRIKKSISFASTKNLDLNEKEIINEFLEKEIQDKNMKDINEKNIFEFTWDDSLENFFKQSKKMGKNLFIKEKNNGKWNGIPLMNIIQTIFTEEKKFKERSTLLDKYANQEPLTPEEFKFLADTSDLLNKCIDKNYIQKAVNIIDPSILHYMELNLAEEIIKHHKRMTEIVQFARQEYFRSKNELTLSKMTINDNKRNKKQLIQYRNESRLKKQKTLSNVIQKVSVQEIINQNLHEQELLNDLNQNKTYADYEKKLKNNQKIKELNKLSLGNNIFEPKVSQIFSGFDHPKVVKHRYHPSSKLFYFNKKEVKEKKNFEFYLKSLEKNIHDYKIQIGSPPILKMPKFFKHYYSGGPNYYNSEPFFNCYSGEKIREPTKDELKCIIYVQSRVRGYITRKKFKELKEEAIKNKFLKIHDKVVLMHESLLMEQENNKNIKSDKSNKTDSTLNLNNLPKKKSKIISEINNSSDIFLTKVKTSIISNKTSNQKIFRLFDLVLNDKFLLNNTGFHYSSKEIDSKDIKNNTPLYYSTLKENFDNCEYLINNGANPNEKCQMDNTPMHNAIKSKKIDIILLLIKNSGDIDLKNINNKTPWDYADDYIKNYLKIKGYDFKDNKRISTNIHSLEITSKSSNHNISKNATPMKNLSSKNFFNFKNESEEKLMKKDVRFTDS